MEDNPKEPPRIKGSHNSAKALLICAGIKEYPLRIRDLIPSIIKDYPDIRFHSTDRLPKKVYAMTIRSGNDVDIAFNNTVTINRQKFSFAHELGHLYMNHTHGGAAIDLDSPSAAEREANEFAAELLMPIKEMRKVLSSTPATIDDLIKVFEVSEEALWWRLNSTGLWKLLRA